MSYYRRALERFTFFFYYFLRFIVIDLVNMTVKLVELAVLSNIGLFSKKIVFIAIVDFAPTDDATALITVK